MCVCVSARALDNADVDDDKINNNDDNDDDDDHVGNVESQTQSELSRSEQESTSKTVHSRISFSGFSGFSNAISGFSDLTKFRWPGQRNSRAKKTKLLQPNDYKTTKTRKNINNNHDVVETTDANKWMYHGINNKM